MPTSLPLPVMRDDECPVPDDLLGKLYRAGVAGIGPLTAPLSARQRARLAIFCYGRAHLRDVGFAIAAICDLAALVDVAGRAGEIIYAQANDAHGSEIGASPTGRHKITLATSILRTFAALDEDDELDVEHETTIAYAEADTVVAYAEPVLA